MSSPSSTRSIPWWRRAWRARSNPGAATMKDVRHSCAASLKRSRNSPGFRPTSSRWRRRCSADHRQRLGDSHNRVRRITRLGGNAMANSHAAILSPFDVARAASRNIRLTVVVSVVLICGSFAAAAALQMRNDRAHALAQADYFEARRAADVAVVAEASLARIADLGRAFAGGKEVREAAHVSGIRNITLFD